MDAWLPKFTETSGRTIAVVRNNDLLKIVKNANFNAKLIAKEEVIESQAGGLRHKTNGFMSRVKLYTLFGSKVPERFKRISKPHSFVDMIEQFLRLRVSWLS